MNSELLNFAVDTVKGAEKILMKYYSPAGITYDIKDDKSPVTVADKEAEDYIINKIKEKYPEHSILSEETGDDNKTAKYKWVIDPIDGTKNFTRGLPLFGTLLALFDGDDIILGVSNVPLLDELMYAEKDEGAFLNGEKISVSKVTSLTNSFISTGNLNYFKRHNLFEKIANIREDVYQFRIIGDLYAYHLLAQGKIDVVMEGSVKIYDIAPLKIIVEEAGGKMTELDGSVVGLTSTTALASNGLVHDEIIRYLGNDGDGKGYNED